jgi:hypothetical protein
MVVPWWVEERLGVTGSSRSDKTGGLADVHSRKGRFGECDQDWRKPVQQYGSDGELFDAGECGVQQSGSVV